MRNIFSLIGWYYHLSRYGEDLKRPTLVGLAIILLSTFLFVSQTNPNLTPPLDATTASNNKHIFA